MLIKRKEYDNLLKVITELKIENNRFKEMNKIAEDRIAGYINQYHTMQNDNEELKEAISILQNRNTTLDISVQDLLNENAKLVDWITKVINDLGCYKVSDNSVIEIPILNNDLTRFNETNKAICGRRITIPEIKFYKIS